MKIRGSSISMNFDFQLSFKRRANYAITDIDSCAAGFRRRHDRTLKRADYDRFESSNLSEVY